MVYENKDIDDFKQVLGVSTLKEEDINKNEFGYVIGTYLLLAAQRGGIDRMTAEEGGIKIFSIVDWTKLVSIYLSELEKSKKFLSKFLARGKLDEVDMKEVMKLKDFAERNLKTFYHKHFQLKKEDKEPLHYMDCIYSGYFYCSLFTFDTELKLIIYQYVKKDIDKISKHIELRRILKIAKDEQDYIEEISKKIFESNGINNLNENDQQHIFSVLAEMHQRTNKLLNHRFFEVIYDSLDFINN